MRVRCFRPDGLRYSPMFTFWAKSGRDQEAAMHSVPHHCLDVAAVAAVLLTMLHIPVNVAPASEPWW
jgi:HD domain